MPGLWLRHRGVRLPLRHGETTLGRSSSCTILVSGHRVSRLHAVIRVSDEGATIADLGSTNGTLVNGSPLTEARPLFAGDVIAVGSEVLDVCEGRDDVTTTQHERLPSEPPTNRGLDTLSIVESLLSAPRAESGQSEELGRTLVDRLLDDHDRQQLSLDEPSLQRIERIAESLVATRPSLNSWRDQLRGRLRG